MGTPVLESSLLFQPDQVLAMQALETSPGPSPEGN